MALDHHHVDRIEETLRTAIGEAEWLDEGFRRGLVSDDDLRSFWAERPTERASARLAQDSPVVLYWCVRDGVTPTEDVPLCVTPLDVDPRALEEEIASSREGPTVPPRKPFVRELARRVCAWRDRGGFPISFRKMGLLEETGSLDDASLASMTPLVSRFAESPDPALAGEFLRALGVRGIRALLGLRTTRGTREDVLPPGIGEMIAAFRARQSIDSPAMLTVGARALAKHCKRSTDGWWGDGLRGTEREKNGLAERVLARILTAAAWLNVHALPHDVFVFEVRNELGFGARWCCAPPFEFRGFLEPQMADGHEKGWVH